MKRYPPLILVVYVPSYPNWTVPNFSINKKTLFGEYYTCKGVFKRVNLREQHQGKELKMQWMNVPCVFTRNKKTSTLHYFPFHKQAFHWPVVIHFFPNKEKRIITILCHIKPSSVHKLALSQPRPKNS